MSAKEEKPEILGLGEICKDWVSVIPHFPKPDEKVDSEMEDYFGGGVTANYITATTRLGIKSAFIGAVGDDDAGDFLIQDMIREKSITKFVVKKKGMKTAVNFIFVVKEGGQKTIIQSPYLQTTKLTPEEIKLEWFKGAKLLHTTAVHEDLTLKSFEYAKENKLKISLDLESQIAIRGIKRLKPILDQVDILLPNKMGAMTITKQKSPIEAAKEFIKWGIETVVITLGEKGAMAITKNGIFEAPAFEVKAVDATGAGDTFCAAFSYGNTLKKWPLEKSLVFANAAASIKMLKLGARTGMPTLKETIDFLHNHKYDEF
jgi:sugar/nucleoside kinase (ribokinase family)